MPTEKTKLGLLKLLRESSAWLIGVQTTIFGLLGSMLTSVENCRLLAYLVDQLFSAALEA